MPWLIWISEFALQRYTKVEGWTCACSNGPDQLQIKIGSYKNKATRKYFGKQRQIIRLYYILPKYNKIFYKVNKFNLLCNLFIATDKDIFLLNLL